MWDMAVAGAGARAEAEIMDKVGAGAYKNLFWLRNTASYTGILLTR